MAAAGPELSDRDFERVRERIAREAGISLGEAKRMLAASRLGKVMRSLGFESFGAYLDFLEREGRPADREAFVNALTTNLTRFWREEHHFEHLANALPRLMARRAGTARGSPPRLRIWSAGCSTGQEAYSIALTAMQAAPELLAWDFRILATDIDTAVLRKAASGIYPRSELPGLSPQRMGLFEPAANGCVRVPERIRGLVTFKPLNLMAPWPMRGPFDAIFCRNVAIYFSRERQAELFTRLGGMLAPDGYLYLGHSEHIGAEAAGFRLVGKTTYQRVPEGRRDAA